MINPHIKNSDSIKKMRTVGQMAADVLTMIAPHVQEGITTLELNDICHNYIVNELDAYPAPLNYHGFPKSVCISINDVVCHGIPSNRSLRNGDIVNIDVTVLYDGHHGDTSYMFHVGPEAEHTKNLIQVTKDCLYLAIQLVKPGLELKQIGRIIQSYAHHHRYSVVEDFCGHGIGTQFHENNFQVLHYFSPLSPSFVLQEGMTFTIEPMINIGKKHTKILKDKWTAVTKDGSLSAQWEHTLLVTRDGCDILTKRKDEITLPSQAALAWKNKYLIT